MSEILRLTLNVNKRGLTDVYGPLEDKHLCRDMLRDAALVISRAAEFGFKSDWHGPGAYIVVTLDASGRVDVGAPLPNKTFCEHMLKAARIVIDMYDDAKAPLLPGQTEVNA
jgi:hypothetical protein